MSAALQASHIVCLEETTARLYAEVIQIISERQSCWARPILIIKRTTSQTLAVDDSNIEVWLEEGATLHDLREGADLLLPVSLFRMALDTEMIPLLMRLDLHKPSVESDRASHQILREFVQQLCTTYPDAFQS